MFPDTASDCQKFVHMFNEDEAIWRSYEQKCLMRRLVNPLSPLPVDLLDAIDWLEAERETRPMRAIGTQSSGIFIDRN